MGDYSFPSALQKNKVHMQIIGIINVSIIFFSDNFFIDCNLHKLMILYTETRVVEASSRGFVRAA